MEISAESLLESARENADSGNFAEALRLVNMLPPEELLRTVCAWSPAIDRYHPESTFVILRDATKILGWVFPTWRDVYQQLL